MAGLADGDAAPMATSHPPHPQAHAQVLRLPLRWNRTRASTHPRGDRNPRRLREVSRMITLELTEREADEVREAILETRNEWSPTLDRVTKEILQKTMNPQLHEKE